VNKRGVKAKSFSKNRGARKNTVPRNSFWTTASPIVQKNTNRFPVFRGVVFWEDFVRWRTNRNDGQGQRESASARHENHTAAAAKFACACSQNFDGIMTKTVESNSASRFGDEAALVFLESEGNLQFTALLLRCFVSP
jgi:hypothetical protein